MTPATGDQLAVTELVGRAAEQDVLERGVVDAGRSQPRVVVVQGDPGIGKTAVIEDFQRRLSAVDAVIVVRAGCVEHEQDIGFAGLGLVLGEWLDASESVLSAGRRLLSWFDEQQADDRVVVLLLDDVQWMDLQSAEALRFTLRRLRSDRVLTVVARRRPDQPDGWAGLLSDTTLTTVVEPAPLTAAQVMEMASMGGDPAAMVPAEAVEVVRRTGGVPLLVKSVLARSQGGTGPALRGPLSPVTAVRQLLRGVSAEALSLVQALAVIAEPSEPAQLGAVAGTTQTFDALTGALRTTVIAVSDTGKIQFSHALLREAVYADIPLPRRRQLHLRAADHATADRALAHRVLAAEQPDQALTDQLTDAAHAARRNNQPGLSATHRLRARAVTPDPAEHETLLLQALCDRLDNYDLAGATELEPEAQQTRDSALRSYALGLLARDHGHPDRAATLLTTAIDRAETAGQVDLAARAAIELARMHASLNNGPQVLAAIRHADQAAEPELVARATTMLGVGEWQCGRIGRAIDILDPMPRTTGSLSEADRFAARGMVRYYHGDLTGSVHDLDYAISLSHLWRPSVMLDRAHIQRFLGHFLIGDWDAAVVDAGTACTLADTGDRPWIAALAHAAAAQVPVHRGEFDVARAHLAQARQANRRVRSTQGDGLLASAAAMLCLLEGDFDGVLGVLTPIRQQPDIFARLQAVRSYRWLMVSLITALVELKRIPEAQEELSVYRQIVARLPEAPGSARLGWLAGRIAEAQGNPVAAAAGYDADLADPRTSKSAFTLAEMLYSSGALERQRGHRREAIDRLSRAKAIFVGLRAAPFVERCDVELARCGIRSSTAAATLGLTEREQDVAALVVKGLTNKEVAAELYLTPKTIEYHLGNIYARCGIAGRRELRRRLTQT